MIVVWIIIFALIYTVNIKKYKLDGIIYGFITVYNFCPITFGIKGMPFSRLLLLLFIFFCLWKDSYKLRFGFKNKKMLWDLRIVLILFLSVYIYTLIFESTEISDLLVFLLEKVVLIFVLVLQIKSEEKLDRCLNAIACSAGIYYICGLIQAVTSINITDCLFLTADPIVLSERFGLTRISVTQSPITYGYYCVGFEIILMYLLKKHNKSIYRILFYMGIPCVLLSVSRGAILFLGVYLVYLFASNIKSWSKKKVFRIIGISIIMIFSLLIIIVWNHQLIDALTKVINATIYVFDKSKTFIGLENNDASGSRLSQLYSIIEWNSVNNKSLFGFGMNAYTDELIRWKWAYNGSWITAAANDTGYADMLAYGGLIYLVAYMALFVVISQRSIKHYLKTKNPIHQLFAIWCVMFWIGNLQTIFFGYNLMVLMVALIIACYGNNIYGGKC